ncbi:MAG: Rrf2 family transcriptional regulator [Clostridia bacterium]|nr:Rrf2 family transcriptional regulator [Clostridia bacterium]
MIISTKGRYGLRAVFELAKAHGQGTMSIKSIAEMQDLSEQYLEQIFSKLKGAGLLVSTRGAGGGYKLAFDPKDIAVGKVLTVLEGELAPAECVGDDAAQCDNVALCTTHVIWQRIYDGFNDVIYSITLADMVDDYQKMLSSKPQAKDVRC